MVRITNMSKTILTTEHNVYLNNFSQLFQKLTFLTIIIKYTATPI